MNKKRLYSKDSKFDLGKFYFYIHLGINHYIDIWVLKFLKIRSTIRKIIWFLYNNMYKFRITWMWIFLMMKIKSKYCKCQIYVSDWFHLERHSVAQIALTHLTWLSKMVYTTLLICNKIYSIKDDLVIFYKIIKFQNKFTL